MVYFCLAKKPINNGLSIADTQLVEKIQPDEEESDAGKLQSAPMSEGVSLDDTFKTVVSHFTNSVLNGTIKNVDGVSDDDKSEASAIASLLQDKLNKNNLTVETENTPSKVQQEIQVEMKNPAVESSWGDWGECSAKCGIGHTSRALQCQAEECAKTPELFQTKACRMEICDGMSKYIEKKL